jgi:hypothetical protein
MRRLARHAGVAGVSGGEVRRFLQLEAAVQERTTGVARWRIYRALTRALFRRVPLRPGLGRRPVVSGRVRQYARALRALSPW